MYAYEVTLNQYNLFFHINSECMVEEYWELAHVD
jgi:hypothetical protein